MDKEDFSDEIPPVLIIEEIAKLALRQEESALLKLRKFLGRRFILFGEHHVAVTRLATRALLQKGKMGVQILSESVLETPSKYDVGVILEALWHAAHGQLPPKGILFDLDLIPPLDTAPSNDTVESAKQSFHEIIEESQFNEDLFEKLLLFQFQAMMSAASFIDEISPEERKSAIDLMRSVVFELFAEPAIKITRRLISTFESLISENCNEEEYQKFLTKHPVFIDPLASEVIPKQKLGIEHITDFVIPRLDNEYILVEIEKPQDAIFTSTNDLTAKFTHAYGQVLDFQEWVDAHGEYARTLMPGIFSPKGVLSK